MSVWRPLKHEQVSKQKSDRTSLYTGLIAVPTFPTFSYFSYFFKSVPTFSYFLKKAPTIPTFSVEKVKKWKKSAKITPFKT